MPRKIQRQGQELTVTREDECLEHPPMFRVLLHNDDYTPMDFVTMVLREIFHHTEAAAVRIMLSVHKRGVGVAGVYPHEVAETKAHIVTELARAEEHPLKCTIEPE